MSYRHQELTSPEQMATGKDFSNPLIVDSLLKTIWSSMHHVFTMKRLSKAITAMPKDRDNWIKKLESKVKTRKAKKRARVMLSKDEEDDSSKQGRKISDIDEDLNTYLQEDESCNARETPSTTGRVVYAEGVKRASEDKE
ncbi:hypothetical protein Tco_0738566 [Tanacetum coccineum]